MLLHAFDAALNALCVLLFQVSALLLQRDAQALEALLTAIRACLPPHAVLPPDISNDVLTMYGLGWEKQQIFKRLSKTHPHPLSTRQPV